MVDLSIIILNYKQKGLVKQCLKGILASQPELDYEIIVVDNNSGDGCLAEIKDLWARRSSESASQLSLLDSLKPKPPPLITIQADHNGGFAFGNNLGIKKVSGQYVLILNPDIAVVTGGLEKMVKFMKAHPEVGMIGPKLINPDGSIQDSCRRFPKSTMPLYRRTVFGRLPGAKKMLDYYLMADWDHQKSAPIDWLFAACLLASRSVLEKIGLFDERFFMYFEDLDLCRRCWAAGFKVYYFAEVEMVHYHQRLSAEKSGLLTLFNKAGRIHLMSGLKYFVKYFGAKLPDQN